nr:histone-lysine N-methyltransferase family member SUVH9-like [Tanacetum cinerariifolium]
MFPKLEPLDEPLPEPENYQNPNNIVPTICLSDDDEVADPDALELMLVGPEETQVVNFENSLKRKNTGSPSVRVPKVRNDLRVVAIMWENDLWLNIDKWIVGPVPGVSIGDVFFFWMELCVLGIHGVPQAGIDFLSASMSLNKEQIVTSVIVSGGYEDDEDSGTPMGYVSLDIFMNKENVPVFFFNDINDNNEPVHYEYLARTVFSLSVYQASRNGDSVGCFCVDVCGLDCACAKKNGDIPPLRELSLDYGAAGEWTETEPLPICN